MNFEPAGNGRLLVALIIFAALAALAWCTMEPGKPRSLTMILLGFFTVRTLLGRARSR